ncbi:uncharacterized protein [Montipora foliosa]|uniref:uncharacterized protein n=1 Tax=Montipora foliosa TaxID=591990 RepID=UPI0035F14E59
MTRTGKKRQGCPCRTDGKFCTASCKCGSTRKPCKNKDESTSQQTALQTADATRQNQLSEEEEAKLENQRVAEFIDTLDEQTVKALAIKALQRGVGSMEYVDSLLLMEPEDKNASDQEDEDEQGNASSVRVPQPSGQFVDQEPVPDWCKCGCCRTMPQDIENKCCARRNCTSQTRRFRKLCLDAEYLQLCAKNTADIRNDRQDSSSRTFRKAAYRNYILDTHGHLGKRKRKVVPSCCVLCIRRHYPSATGVYMGFRAQ